MTVIILKLIMAISARKNDPFAVRTELGWSLVGPTRYLASSRSMFSHRILVQKLTSITTSAVTRALEIDFLDTNPKDMPQNDIQFLQLKIWYNDKGHLEMPLPFRVCLFFQRTDILQRSN